MLSFDREVSAGKFQRIASCQKFLSQLEPLIQNVTNQARAFVDQAGVKLHQHCTGVQFFLGVGGA